MKTKWSCSSSFLLSEIDTPHIHAHGYVIDDAELSQTKQKENSEMNADCFYLSKWYSKEKLDWSIDCPFERNVFRNDMREHHVGGAFTSDISLYIELNICLAFKLDLSKIVPKSLLRKETGLQI